MEGGLAVCALSLMLVLFRPERRRELMASVAREKAPAPALGAVTQLCPLITATAREHCLARDAAVHRATQWEPLIKPRQCALEPAGRVWRKESDKRKGLKERATGETC